MVDNDLEMNFIKLRADKSEKRRSDSSGDQAKDN